MRCSYRDCREWEPFGCQLEGLLPGLYLTADGKEWCPFHFPVATADGQPTRTNAWTCSQVDDIMRLIEELLRQDQKKLPEGQHVNLSGVVLPGELVISDSSVPPVDFWQAVFVKRVSFRDSRFLGLANFAESTFLDEADFRCTSFAGASFTDGAHFGGCTFQGDVDFAGSTFRHHAGFGSIKCSAGARFGRSEFHHDAVFRSSQFAKGAHFYRCVFRGKANFESSRFGGRANFGGVRFSDDVDFEQAIIDEEASFEAFRSDSLNWCSEREQKAEADMLGEADDRSTFQRVSFRRVAFGGPASFESRNFLRSADFSSCRFRVAPLFHDCVFHQDTDFEDTKFYDTRTRGASRAYRTLKLAMERLRARDEEAQFYALEQRARRAEWPSSMVGRVAFLWFWLLSWGYQIAASHGRSSGRPIAFLLAQSLLFTALYQAIGVGGGGLRAAVDFAARQVVRPFQIWAGDTLIVNPVVLALATIQSVLSVSLVALFVLAVRWRFRR